VACEKVKVPVLALWGSKRLTSSTTSQAANLLKMLLLNQESIMKPLFLIQ
jgi:hypothetical protein